VRTFYVGYKFGNTGFPKGSNRIIKIGGAERKIGVRKEKPKSLLLNFSLAYFNALKRPLFSSRTPNL